MNRTSHVLAALAISAFTSASAIAQAADTPNRPGQGQPTAQPGAQPGQPAAQPGQDGAAMGDAAQIDQQMKQEMTKIQQSPQGALDKLFVLEAGAGGQFEVAFAQQALQKSQDDQVKQLARTIIQDHQQANQQLSTVAQAVGVMLPKGLDSAHAQKLQTYGALDAKDYDRKFLCVNNEAHLKSIEAYKTTAAIATNPQLKQYATTTLPKLQEHHQAIQTAGAKHGVVQPGEAVPASGKLPADRPGGQPREEERNRNPGGTGTPPTPGGTNSNPR